MTTPLGHPMRQHFLFSPTYTSLNHGAMGTYPAPILTALHHFQSLAEARPDPFIHTTYPSLLLQSRLALAALLSVPVDELVLVSNATTATNTVLRGLNWEDGDVIVYFEACYGAVEKTVQYVVEKEGGRVEGVRVELACPVGDGEVLGRFEEVVREVNEGGKGKRRVRLALFDTVCSMPGMRMPWERLVEKCRELGVLSCVDGAHGVGQIELGLGRVRPDFFTSNLHKWLFVPRACAVFYVPLQNQHLIRSTLPTSWGFQPLHSDKESAHDPFPSSETNPFVIRHQFVGTFDCANYLCIPDAIKFRQEVCGGEEKIMKYCEDIAREGGERAAEILGTEVMNNAEGTLTKCAFANVRLPLKIGDGKGEVKAQDSAGLVEWLKRRTMDESDTYLQTILYRGNWWWRISGQIYLEVEDVAWGAEIMKKLCERIRKGEHVERKA